MSVKNPWVRGLIFAAIGLFGGAAFIYGLPLVLPFLLGWLAAILAEPLTKILNRKLPRAIASGLSLTAFYLSLCLILWFLGKAALVELNRLTEQLPLLAQQVQTLVLRGQQWLYDLAAKAPKHLQGQMLQGLEDLFSNGTELAKESAGKLLGAVSRMVLRLPDTLIFLVTAISSGFLISARLPRLRPWIRKKLPKSWQKKVLSLLTNLKANLRGWIQAQIRLMGVTFLILSVGFFVLRLEHPVFTAGILSLVDALPMLGTGTVLIPWAVISLLQGKGAFALGLGALYAISSLSRSFLEPKILGKQLGLSPLVTLAAVYAGFRLGGVLGMILAPLGVITFAQLRFLVGSEQPRGKQNP